MENQKRLAVVFIGTTILASCGVNPPPPPVRLTPLVSALGPGWVEAPLPDGKLTPGSMIQITEVSGEGLDLRYLGRLQDCGVPSDAVFVENGATPAFNSSAGYSLGANVAGSIASANGSAEASAAATATLKVTAAVSQSLNLIRFRAWYATPLNTQLFNQMCGPTAAQPNVYVIEEAFVVSNGTLSVENKAGVKLELTPPTGMPFKGGVDASGRSSGDLSITQPVVLAIKRMRQVDSMTWGTLGMPASAEDESATRLVGKRVVRFN